MRSLVATTLLLAPTFISGHTHGHYLQPKDGACVPTDEASVISITLGKNNREIGACVNKCMNDEECRGIQFTEPKFCDLHYSRIKKIEGASDGTYCGRKSQECKDSASFVFGSYEYKDATYEKDCAWIVANEKKIDIRRASSCGDEANGFPISSMCPEACDLCPSLTTPETPEECGDSPTYFFGSYEYEDVITLNDCAWITANENKIETRRSLWCDELVNDYVVKDMCQAACGVCDEPSSIDPPTDFPTLWSGSSCILDANLAFPFSTPDDATYNGYSADYMSVTMDGDDYWECSYVWSDSLPDWCTYSNSFPGGDSAYVANVDDYYFDDGIEALWAENIKISGAAGNTYTFLVTHWFFNQDYYPDLDTWNDHMMAAVLKVKNLSNPNQNEIKKRGWSRPVDIDVKTHIQKPNGAWTKNPEFPDKFEVTISCDDDCFCSGSFSLV